MGFWEGRDVLVTGGSGFIGSWLCKALTEAGAQVLIVDLKSDKARQDFHGTRIPIKKVDLARHEDNPWWIFTRQGARPDVLFHLAAKVGGIAFNKANQETMFTENALINTNVLAAISHFEIPLSVVVSSACVYPNNYKSPDLFPYDSLERWCQDLPISEIHGFDGDPEPTNFGYGWAKRMLEVQAGIVAREKGLNIAIARPTNAYGPLDNFGPGSHFIPAKITEALRFERPIKVWGDGTQVRSFIHARDLARGLMLMAEQYPGPDPINLTGKEASVAEVTHMILDILGENGGVVFDHKKPSGHPRRVLSGERAYDILGFLPEIPLRAGMEETIFWARNANIASADAAL